jgi:hypothetical protein
LIKSGGYGGLIVQCVIARLRFGWRDISDRLQRPAVFEPVDPFKRGELDVVMGLIAAVAVRALEETATKQDE